MPVGDLIRSQLHSEEEFTNQRSSQFKTVYNRKFQTIVENVVERKMYHARQTLR